MPIVHHQQGPADRLLELLEAIPEFKPAVQEMTLLSSLLATEHLSPFEQFFKDAKRSASVINGVDCHTRLQTLGSASLGTMIPQIQDQFGFQQTCDQAKATNYNVTLIQNLIVPLFGKHVNDHLSSKSFQSLDQFRKQPDLVNRFTELITADSSDFSVPDKLEECASVGVVANWARRLLDQAVALQADEAAKQIETHILTLVQAASSIYNPTGRSDLHILDYAKEMQAADQLLQEHHLTQLGDKIKDALMKGSQGVNEDGLFSEANLHAWQALSNNLWNAWDFSVRDTSAGGQWKAAVQGAETQEDVKDTPNGGDLRHVHRTQTWGRVVRDWLQVNVDQGFVNSQNFGSIHNSAHSFARVDPPETQSSCFAPGTRVLTDLGGVPIENLQEHSRVVTRLSDGLKEWGSCSDEKVRMPSPTVLYGFNDDSAFFTAGHVFFTTTGLRAVSPELATAENPWCNPGQLRVGHILLHTSDGQTYSKYRINAMHSERSTDSYVYGVHLREGLRSYHANGFLVALNYPEITVATLAKQLMQVPRKERLDLIGKLRELKPILERFGGETTLQALECESSSEALHYTGPRHHQKFHLRHVNYPYRMTMEDGKRGPAVDLVEGVLFVDGQYCERASIDKDHISWSRPLSDGKWEYAACHFSNRGLNGSGFMHVNDHPDVVDKKDHNTLMSESPAMPFFLAASTENHAGAHAMSNASAGELTWDIMYDPKPDEGTNEDDPDVVTLCTEDLGRVVKKDSEDNYSPYPIKDLQIYDGLLEKIVAKAKENLNDSGAEALKGIDSLYKRRTWYDVRTGAQNYEWILAAPEAIIHNSDQFAQFETDHKAWEDKGDANTPEPQLSMRDLTFKKSLGTDFELKIPMLINSISTVWTSNGSEFMGTVRAYDPLGDGNNGPTHLVAGSRTVEPPLFFAAIRAASEVSSTVPIHEAHAPAPRLNIHLLKLTKDTNSKKIDALANIRHDQKDINQKTEEIIKKVMLYHMDGDERHMFFKVARPTDLDEDFAERLDTTCGADTKDWFKKTYARAYICQILTQHSIGLDGAQKFTETEKRNIRYFWNGHGTSCLSREDRYKTLEKKIARKLILNTVLSGDLKDTIQNSYANDHGGKGGDYWSEAILAYYNNPKTLQDKMNPSVGNGDNLLTKMAAIMDALDQGLERTGDEKHLLLNSTNSNILCYASNKANLGDVWSQQFMDFHAKDKQAAEEQLQEMWFEESLALIVEDLLGNSDLVSGDLNKGLQEDVQKLRDEMGIQADAAKKDQAKTIAKMFGASAKGMIKLLVATRRGIAGAFWKAASYMRGIPVIGRGIDWIWKKAKSEPGTFFTEGKERMFKGIMLVGSIAFMGWSLFKAFNPDKATGKSQWDSSGPVERAQTILNAFGMTKSIAEFGTDFTDICLRIKRPGTFSRSAEAAVDATLDAMAQRKLATEWVYFEKGSDGVASTKVQSFLETADTVDEIAQAEGNIGSALPASGEVGFNCTEEMIKACSKLKRAFNIARKTISCVGYVLAIAVAVFMTWKLIQDWDGMDTWHRTIETIQVVCAALEAIASVVMIVVTFGAGAAFAATMSAIFSAVSLVLLAIVVLAMIILAIWEATRPPPESPISQWIDNTGKHIDTWCPGLSAPATPLTVSSNVPDGRLRNSGDAQEVDILFTNTSAQTVKLDALELQFDVGPDKSAFFTEAEQINKKPDNSSLDNHQFEVSVNGSAKLSVADPVNLPKTQSVKANEKPNAFTVKLTVTGATGELDSEGHCPFELQPNDAVVFKIKAVSNIQVVEKVDVGVTWRQFWNQGEFDQDEDLYWFTRDK